MLVRVLVGGETAQPFCFGEVVDTPARIALDERAFQQAFKGLARDAAGREGAAKRVRGVAANGTDTSSFDRPAVERAPGHRLGAPPLDPLFVKSGLATCEEPDVGRHVCSVMGDKPLKPTVVVAMPMAQNQAVDTPGIEVKQVEVADQYFGCKSEIQKILGLVARLSVRILIV